MTDETPDWYDVLQVSPRADAETIVRVFRYLAKRLHPDNPESGNAEQFALVMDAFKVLSDPERRAAYDSRYEHARERRWRIFDHESAVDSVLGDRMVRESVMKLLYTARRGDPDQPGLGIVHIEQLLGVPEQHLKFHIWYLRENGWVMRLDNGMLAITASGVDHVLDLGGPGPDRVRQIEAGSGVHHMHGDVHENGAGEPGLRVEPDRATEASG